MNRTKMIKMPCWIKKYKLLLILVSVATSALDIEVQLEVSL